MVGFSVISRDLLRSRVFQSKVLHLSGCLLPCLGNGETKTALLFHRGRRNEGVGQRGLCKYITNSFCNAFFASDWLCREESELLV